MDAFWRKGYEATSLADLTAATGLNKASLYRVFGDKHALFMAALRNYADTEMRESRAVIDESRSPLTNIRAVVRKVITDFAHEKGCLMINSLVELGPHDGVVADLLQNFSSTRVEALTGLIEQARQAGEVRTELDPARLAQSLMITLAGSAAMARGFLPREVICENLENLIDGWT